MLSIHLGQSKLNIKKLNKEICIIGATSALGKNLVSLLAGNGYEVNATYRTEDRVPENWHTDTQITPKKLDLSKDNDFKGLLAKNVIWLAHLEQGRFNEREAAANLGPFNNFLSQIKDSTVEKVIFVSSGGSVYGEPVFLPITEDHPRDPLSSYGKTKKAMEDKLTEASKRSNIKSAIIRPGNIYGFEVPNLDNKGIIGAYLNAISSKKTFTLIHKGQTVRDFIHVNDVSSAILTALSSSEKDIIWNVATETGTRTEKVLEMVLQSSGLIEPVIEHIENFSSDVSANILSIEMIKTQSDWRPQYDLQRGISETVKNWLDLYNKENQTLQSAL